VRVVLHVILNLLAHTIWFSHIFLEEKVFFRSPISPFTTPFALYRISVPTRNLPAKAMLRNRHDPDDEFPCPIEVYRSELDAWLLYCQNHAIRPTLGHPQASAYYGAIFHNRHAHNHPHLFEEWLDNEHHLRLFQEIKDLYLPLAPRDALAVGFCPDPPCVQNDTLPALRCPVCQTFVRDEVSYMRHTGAIAHMHFGQRARHMPAELCNQTRIFFALVRMFELPAITGHLARTIATNSQVQRLLRWAVY
jgi:uncharacterized C2H2 Zn-finger protein